MWHVSEVDKECHSLAGQILKDQFNELRVGMMICHPFFEFVDASEEKLLSFFVSEFVEMVQVFVASAAVRTGCLG